jgi:hypothetical protein
MSGLPWVRLDSNIGTNMKIARLLKQRDGHRAFVMYVCALGWSGGHGTDGYVPEESFTFIHGTDRLAGMLAAAGLFDRADDEGWQIRNYEERQEMAEVTELKQAQKRRAICARWMREGKRCTCGAHEEK